MRNAFAKAIQEVAAQDERVVLLSGDIGNRMFDRYKEMFAGRFYNCGVAEANMVSLAAGLALSGLRPYLYTITPFVTYRVYEQIRVDLCYHHQPVVIVGTGAGLSYASLGATHHSCEDIAVMRALPGMTVVCPGDPWEVAAATKAALGCDGPVFLRIGKKGEPTVHKELADFQIGKANPVRAGRDVCLISTGNLLPLAVETAGALAEAGVSAGVVSMHTVKPLDQAKLEEVFFGPCRLVVTLEEHSLIGGLGGAVAEWLVDREVERTGAVPGSLPGAG
ncbi:MAG: transketolase family protein, partial [Phycisphaeraceae bacterium]|nr:transketolase family protein [Phycisphaeraceae bacterium]